MRNQFSNAEKVEGDSLYTRNMLRVKRQSEHFVNQFLQFQGCKAEKIDVYIVNAPVFGNLRYIHMYVQRCAHWALTKLADGMKF